MNLKQICEKLDLRVLSGEDKLDQDVKVAYCSDVLSDVMAKAAKGCIWISNQTHENVLAIAYFKNLAAVILTENQIPEDTVLEKAKQKNITLLLTDLKTFEIVGKLWEIGIKG
jgi:serine kinase of HPr protein (carbohydrate metabolism regulator)